MDILDRLADGATFEQLLAEGLISDKDYTEIVRADKKEMKAKKRGDPRPEPVETVRHPVEEPKPVQIIYSYIVIQCNTCGGFTRHLLQTLVKYKVKAGLTHTVPVAELTDDLQQLVFQKLSETQESTFHVAICSTCLGQQQ